jgi:hypothetical protein
MLFRLAAELTLLVHLAFIAFAVFGAALTLLWRWTPALHLPVAAWAVWIELTGGICPLTYVENHFRIRAGGAGYPESFIEHYLLALIYPSGLTREIQLALAGLVVAVNVALYAWLVLRWRASRHAND